MPGCEFRIRNYQPAALKRFNQKGQLTAVITMNLLEIQTRASTPERARTDAKDAPSDAKNNGKLLAGPGPKPATNRPAWPAGPPYR